MIKIFFNNYILMLYFFILIFYLIHFFFISFFYYNNDDNLKDIYYCFECENNYCKNCESKHKKMNHNKIFKNEDYNKICLKHFKYYRKECSTFHILNFIYQKNQFILKMNLMNIYFFKYIFI